MKFSNLIDKVKDKGINLTISWKWGKAKEKPKTIKEKVREAVLGKERNEIKGKINVTNNHS